MTNEKINALKKAQQESIDNHYKIAIIHFGGYEYGVCELSDVPEDETRTIAVFENGKEISYPLKTVEV